MLLLPSQVSSRSKINYQCQLNLVWCTEYNAKTASGSDDDKEDDDDGLPDEYDYNDSFINDDELQDSMRNDRAGKDQFVCF